MELLYDLDMHDTAVLRTVDTFGIYAGFTQRYKSLIYDYQRWFCQVWKQFLTEPLYKSATSEHFAEVALMVQRSLRAKYLNALTNQIGTLHVTFSLYRSKKAILLAFGVCASIQHIQNHSEWNREWWSSL